MIGRLPRSMLARFTPLEAARYHWCAMTVDRRHQRSSCWCCCASCDFNPLQVLENDLADVEKGQPASSTVRSVRQGPWPAHLYEGTCGKGHARTPENTRVREQDGRLKRECKTCRHVRESGKSKPERSHQLEYLRRKELGSRGRGMTMDDEILIRRYPARKRKVLPRNQQKAAPITE